MKCTQEKHVKEVKECPMCGQKFCWNCKLDMYPREKVHHQQDLLNCPRCKHNYYQALTQVFLNTNPSNPEEIV